MRHVFLAFALLGSACLDPLVSDEPGASLHILPPLTQVPHVSTNPDLTRQIRVNDGLSDSALEMAMGVIALKNGFAGGTAVKYWDLGTMPETGALLYVLVKRSGETFVPIAEHPMIADSLPGDPGYSPYWFVQNVVVTDRYLGEVLPTVEAIADAVELGLVEEPVPAETFVDGPIVPLGTSLSLGEGVPPQQAVRVLARGYQVDMLLVGGIREIERAGRVTRGDVHTVRVGNAVNPLREPVFQNGSDHWTPAVRLIECRVTEPANPEDPAAKIDDEAKLFERDDRGAMTAATDRVIDWTITTTTKNWPIFVPEAAP